MDGSSSISDKHYLDDPSDEDEDMSDEQSEAVFRARTRKIKAVRVELDYASPTAEQEQAQKSKLIGKQVPTAAVNELAAARREESMEFRLPSKRNSANKDNNSATATGAAAAASAGGVASAVSSGSGDMGASMRSSMRSSQRKNNHQGEVLGKMSKPKTTRKINKKKLEESNLADDEIGDGGGAPSQCNFLLATMLTGISYYYVITLMVIISWSIACTWYVQEMRAIQEEDPVVKDWLLWFDELDVRMIGSLFVFSLVFRFNQCYNRWWQGRLLWGEIIQNCLDLSRKSTLWIVNKELSTRMNRYIVCFPYAAKAQLRGLSLADETESGRNLVVRGFLTEEELDYLVENPCWEPDFFLDLMRAVIAKAILLQWEREPDEQILILPHSNRIHDRLFPPLDKAVYDLGKSIGEGVSVRSAGLPRSYDTVHYIFFWIYFLLAPPAEAATIGWLSPVILGFSACIIMTLMDMGTAMVDPFGTDLVDLPIERFCETIEAQVMTIQQRHKTSAVMDFASSSIPTQVFHELPQFGRRNTVMDLAH